MATESIWRKIFRPLLNERGEVGNVQGSEGAEDANLDEGSQSSGDAETAAPEGEGQESATPAEALNTEAEGQESQGGQEVQEGEQTTESEKVPWHKDPRWQAWQKEQKQIRQQAEQEKARADFYENHFNERFNAEMAQRERGQSQPATETPTPLLFDPSKLPEGVKAPAKWENGADIANYVHNAVSTIDKNIPKAIEAEITRAWNQGFMPVLQSISQRFTAFAEEVMKARYEDFDDVIKSANEDIFTMDPGGKILGVKNQALLDYINKDPIPQRALYQHGLKKKAPQKIAETKQKTTKEIIQKLNTKPKGPSVPSGGGGGQTATGALTWTTPKEEAGKVLRKRGVL